VIPPISLSLFSWWLNTTLRRALDEERNMYLVPSLKLVTREMLKLARLVTVFFLQLGHGGFRRLRISSLHPPLLVDWGVI